MYKKNCLRTWITLDTVAFNCNVKYLKKLAGNRAIAAVIKGNGYGHGLLPMAILCEQNSTINLLCVAFLSEAVFLRKQGITKPILVLSYIDVPIVQAIQQDISFMLDSLHIAEQLNLVASKHNTTFEVHIKIDTGLCRHGITPACIPLFLDHLTRYKCIGIAGMYSHFVQSHIADQQVTKQQKNRFIASKERFFGKKNFFMHMSNSASLLLHTIPQETNLIRVGLALYGLWPSLYVKKKAEKKICLQPILTWKTVVQAIKKVNKHTSFGYNYLFTTHRKSSIAILPVGYADGLLAILSNKASVEIKGRRAPIVGKIAMNTCFVDVTDIADVAIGDEVIIIGKNQSAQTYADWCDITNVREFLTGISSDIKKIIV